MTRRGGGGHGCRCGQALGSRSSGFSDEQLTSAVSEEMGSSDGRTAPPRSPNDRRSR
jgi:hypothetical protein